MNVLLTQGQCTTGDGMYVYQAGRCAQCGRPIVRLPGGLPAHEVRFIRRHLAWWYLDKAYEHAGNTLVLP